MNFEDPKFLWFLLSLPLVMILGWLADRSLRNRLKRYSAIISSFEGALTWCPKKSLLKLVLLVVIFVALVISIATPRWGFEWVDSAHPGADIVIAFDVSESMLATDVKPSRLELAKRKVYDFIDGLKGDRVGLVAFAGTAFLHSPLTADYDAVKSYLDYLRTDLIPLQGTAIGKAIKTSQKSLMSSTPDDSRAKWVIMITDGEDQADNGVGSAKDAWAEGIRIFTLGVGSKDGAPIPDKQGGFKKDGAGKIVLSKLNTAMLSNIAQVAGGKYATASSVGNDLGRFYQQELNLAGNTNTTGDKIKKWHNRYQIFLALVLLLSSVEYLLGEYKHGAKRGGR